MIRLFFLLAFGQNLDLSRALRQCFISHKPFYPFAGEAMLLPILRRYLACACRIGFCLSLLVCAWAMAASPGTAPRWRYMADTVFQQMGTEHGLPHPLVTAMSEDHTGFLWMGTQGGLARWDGYRFQVYKPDQSNPRSLPNNFIQTLFNDQQNRLWIGTLSGGLALYDPIQDNFQRIPLLVDNKPVNQVNALANDGQGGLWIGSDDGLLHLKDGHLQVITEGGKGLLHKLVRTLLLDKDGDLWIGTRRGLMRLPKGSMQPQAYPLPSQGPPHISTLAQSRDGRIWVGSTGQGAYLLDPKMAGSAQKLKENSLDDPEANADNAMDSERLTQILEITPGRIWMSSYTSGLIEFDAATLHTRRLHHEPALPSSLNSDGLLSMLRDRNGQIWVGGFRGLSRYHPGQLGFLTLFGSNVPTRRMRQIDGTDVSSVALGEQGEVLLGMQKQGINILNLRQNLVRRLPTAPRPGTSALPGGAVFSISDARAGEVYIGTSVGLFRYGLESAVLQQIKLDGINQAIQVRSVARDGQLLWVLTEDGMWQLPPGAESARRIPPLAGQQLGVLAKAANGDLWLGTRNNGLLRYTPATGQVLHLRPDLDNPQALASGTVTSLWFDAKGRLWVGTIGGGVHLLQEPAQHQRFVRLSQEYGINEMMIGQMLGDDFGNIWASTASGLLQIDPKTMRSRQWTRADGVHIGGYWNNSGRKGENGELLFGGLGGLTVVRPELLQANTSQPRLAITALRIGGQSRNAVRLNLEPDLRLQIEPQANSLALEFAALDFVAPERRRYAYKLEGYDRDWVETAPNLRLASYTNLPPSDYLLHLRSTDLDGHQIEVAHPLRIRVLPAWYQTWWFYLLMFVAGLLAVFALLQTRTALLRARQRDLAQQVAQRTLQLQAANHQLQDTNLALNDANAGLASSVATLRQLGEIGRDITGNLEEGSVCQALYEHVGQMLDAPFFAIFRMNAQGNALEMIFGRELGEELAPYSIGCHFRDSNVVQVARTHHELLLAPRDDGDLPGHVRGTPSMQSALFAPLMVDEEVLGVMSVQSATRHAYGERERLIFRTLCAYGAIGLANAKFLHALHQAQRQLVQQEKLASLGGLVAGIAHEINTPLGTTVMSVSGTLHAWAQVQDLLNRDKVNKLALAEQVEEGSEYAHLAQKAALRVAELVNTFKSIAVDTSSAKTSRVELAPYLQELVDLICANTWQVAVSVPPGLQAEFVREEMSEALTRVLANAGDHAAVNGILRLQISAAIRGGNQLEIVVSDDGPAIPAQHLGKVFEPFFTTRGGTGGHIGLGLHVAYNHVTRGLGGKIEIHNNSDRGCSVVITIPVANWYLPG